jgi:hypothetical protein
MNRDGRLLREVFVEPQEEASDITAPSGHRQAGDYDDDAARSRKNILQWQSYLPNDCIEAMIRMGWDVTT